jgi:predicted short-subunit dehydrogenase-like oxidoreductase (DUF2520 family)
MFQRIHVIGRGRAGSAIAARLEAKGLLVPDDEPADLVILCVPDRAIAEVAQRLAAGPWVAHVSGATPLRALEPHRQRFGLHPVQTFVPDGGPGQLDGAWAAVTGETAEAREAGRWLAAELGLSAFDLDDDRRALYHAGAAMASNYLVTLHRMAERAFERAGAPPEALAPLMRRTIENGFELTGPIARGDRATIDAHLAALEADLPELLPAYRALAALTVP